MATVDPGSSIVDDLIDALAPERVLVGSVCGMRILNVIDPRTTLLDTNEYYDEDLDQDEEDEDDSYEPWDDELELEQYDEPVPIAKVVVGTDDDAQAAELEMTDDTDGDEVDDPSQYDDETYATDSVLERPEAWFEFREHWYDRAIDPDDEPGEVRWPDPAVEVDRQIAEPACSEHASPLDTCSRCSAPVCLACNDDAPLEGVCTSCLALLELPVAELDAAPSRGRVVS